MLGPQGATWKVNIWQKACKTNYKTNYKTKIEKKGCSIDRRTNKNKHMYKINMIC